MRTRGLMLAALLLLPLTACRRNSISVSAGQPGTTTTPVGPVPGAMPPAQYPTNPFANDPVALQDGRRLFDWYNCSGCHGGHAGGGMGPSLRDPVWLYGNRDDQIYASIVQGRSNGMPAWGSKIPQQQVWELVAYIKSMGTPQEPDPPTEPADEQVPNPQQVSNPTVGTQTPPAGGQQP